MNNVQATLLYHFCRLRLPQVNLPADVFERHTVRAFEMFQAKRAKEGQTATWNGFIDNIYALDWFVASACLEGLEEAWRALFRARANRTDALLVDALRMRAVRLFPRDGERQDEAVGEFWGFLIAGERDGSTPALRAMTANGRWCRGCCASSRINTSLISAMTAAVVLCPKTISTTMTCRFRPTATTAGMKSSVRPPVNG